MRMLPILCALLIHAAAAPAFAANTPVCTALGEQGETQIIPDGSGGALVAWHDARTDTFDIYVQHILPSGLMDPAWPANGRAVCTAARRQRYPQLVTDGAGGAIVVWEDQRTVDTDIYAHHVLASGAVDPAWPAQGLAVCVGGGSQTAPRLVSDGAGGAILAWEDNRSPIDIYAHHVLATGTVDPAWPVNGLGVCTAIGGQQAPELLTDGAGGALVVWSDNRAGLNSDLYAHHVLVSGSVDATWPANGLALCTASGDQRWPRLVTDGSGGAIVAWEDWRNGLPDIFVTRLLSSGVVDPAWVSNGLAVSTASGYQITPQPVSDGAGGVLLVWDDMRSGANFVYAHHVQAGGTVDPGLPANGLALYVSTMWQQSPRAVTDGSGGALVAWSELRDGDSFDVYAQHLLTSGAIDPAWPPDGKMISAATDDQLFPVLAPSAAGVAVVAWADERNGGVADIYSDRTTETVVGVGDDPASTSFELARPQPNPASGRATLRYALARSSAVRLAVYDASGRLVRDLANGRHEPGQHETTWDLRDRDGRLVGAGLYFVRLEAEGRSCGRRLVVTP